VKLLLCSSDWLQPRLSGCVLHAELQSFCIVLQADDASAVRLFAPICLSRKAFLCWSLARMTRREAIQAAWATPKFLAARFDLAAPTAVKRSACQTDPLSPKLFGSISRRNLPLSLLRPLN
jgi:hypothetical protein